MLKKINIPLIKGSQEEILLYNKLIEEKIKKTDGADRTDRTDRIDRTRYTKGQTITSINKKINGIRKIKKTNFIAINKRRLVLKTNTKNIIRIVKRRRIKGGKKESNLKST